MLATPLGLWLLRTIYITPRADPTPLLNLDSSPNAATVQADLLDQLIPTVLATRPASRHPNDTFRPRHRWTPHDVRIWLTYLAHHLHRTGTRDLEWWNLKLLTLTRLERGLLGALQMGLVGLMGGVAVGLSVELTGGLKIGLISGLIGGLTGGLTAGLALGLAAGQVNGIAFCVAAVPPVCLVAGLVTGLIEWDRVTPSRFGWADTPRSSYRLIRATTILHLSLAGCAGGVTGGLTGALASGLTAGTMAGLTTGLIAGLTGALANLYTAAWFLYLPTACWLAASGKLPLRLMDFLDDAYRLGLLRTVGPSYQFRHAEFHDHLIRTDHTQTATEGAVQ